jgi:hypothetical protein
MGWRGLGTAVLLVVVGVAAGLALGFQQRPTVATGETAAPLPAESPAIPIDPPPSVAPDPATPPALAPGLPTHQEIVGGRQFGVAVPVPNGWERFELAAAENRWTAPGNPPTTYSMRVEVVFGERRSIPQIMSLRAEDLDAASDFTIQEQTDDTLVFTYIDATSHRRLQMLRWVAPRGSGTAEVEVAVVGRMRDEAGLADLLDAVSDGAREPADPGLR